MKDAHDVIVKLELDLEECGASTAVVPRSGSRFGCILPSTLRSYDSNRLRELHSINDSPSGHEGPSGHASSKYCIVSSDVSRFIHAA